MVVIEQEGKNTTALTGGLVLHALRAVLLWVVEGHVVDVATFPTGTCVREEMSEMANDPTSALLTHGARQTKLVTNKRFTSTLIDDVFR